MARIVPRHFCLYYKRVRSNNSIRTDDGVSRSVVRFRNIEPAVTSEAPFPELIADFNFL